MTFKQYLKAIDDLAGADGWPADYTRQTGGHVWKDLYDEGYSAAEAWAEEKAEAAAGADQ